MKALNKFLHFTNIRDHSGRVYLPELLWSLFSSTNEIQDPGFEDTSPEVTALMEKIRRKYRDLDQNTTFSQLCGKRYWYTELTVTKYLSGKLILSHMRKYMKAKYPQRKAYRDPKRCCGTLSQAICRKYQDLPSVND